MTEIYSNFPELTKALNKLDKIPDKILIGDKFYKITEQKAIQRGTGELIGRRILGGFLVCISLGILYFKNEQVRELFQKTKSIRVIAVLEEKQIANSAEKAMEVASFLQNKEPGKDDDQTIDLPRTEPKEVEQKERIQPEESPIEQPVEPVKAELIKSALKETEQEDLSFPYLRLPDGVRKLVECHLSINDLIRTSRVSTQLKKTIDEALKTENRQIELFIALLTLPGEKYVSLLKSFLLKPDSLYPLLLFLDNKIKTSGPTLSKEFTNVFKKVMTLLKENGQFNEKFLENLDSSLREKVLIAILWHTDDQSENQALYKKFASHETKFALVARLAQTSLKTLKNQPVPSILEPSPMELNY